MSAFQHIFACWFVCYLFKVGVAVYSLVEGFHVVWGDLKECKINKNLRSRAVYVDMCGHTQPRYSTSFFEHLSTCHLNSSIT